MDPLTTVVTQPRNRWVRVVILCGALLTFAAVMIGLEVLAAVLHLPLLWRVSLGQMGILFIPVVFALCDGDGFRPLGFLAKWESIDFAIIPVIVVAHLMVSFLAAAFLQSHGGLPSTSGVTDLFKSFSVYSPGAFMIYALVLALQAGIGEELLFRGYLITRLEKLGIGALPTILLSALLFGLAHWLGYGFWAALLKAFSFGLPTGAYYYYRRKLGPLIVAHALVDYLGFIAVYVLARLGIGG
jgi:membrane protease YdiL (CAAX protease family)